MKEIKKLTSNQVKELEVFVKDKEKMGVEIKRAQAILLLNENSSEVLICSLTGFNRNYAFKLRSKYLEKGIEGLLTKKRKTKALLTRGQKEEIKRVLRNCSPKDFGISLDFWTTAILGELIEEQYGVKYKSRTSYYLIFKESKFSYHNPGKQYEKRDPEKIDVWEKEVTEKLKSFDFEKNAILLTEDEMILTTQTTCQKVWLPTGEYPRIDVASNRKRRCIYGFLNIFSGQQHAFKTSGANSESTCKLLNEIGKIYPKKKIIIIWDNAIWHKSKEVKQLLTDTKYDFHLINSPPYAPEKNPQEHVWKAGREHMSHNKFIKDIDKTTNEFVAYLSNTRFDYKFLDLK